MKRFFMIGPDAAMSFRTQEGFQPSNEPDSENSTTFIGTTKEGLLIYRNPYVCVGHCVWRRKVNIFIRVWWKLWRFFAAKEKA